jgi:hypothetical protein
MKIICRKLLCRGFHCETATFHTMPAVRQNPTFNILSASSTLRIRYYAFMNNWTANLEYDYTNYGLRMTSLSRKADIRPLPCDVR